MLSILPTWVMASEDLAKKNSCFGCHLVEGKMVGPGFRDIAKKYAGQNGALAEVTKSVREGGTGKWGQIPMPAQGQLSADDAKSITVWILSLAK